MKQIAKQVPAHKKFSTRDAECVSKLRIAMQAAADAFIRSGRILDAALTYAAHGFPIFPLSRGSKAPIPRRDPDPSGQFKDGIPGTGGVYKASTDPLTIRRWWRENPDALIGLPMGERSGVWALDVDTDEDHADNGIAAWETLIAEHGAVVTREHRTATGGLHLIFIWHAGTPIACGKGVLPKGIEVKGQRGYIVVAPSQRKGRSYTVGHDIDPIDAPQWLVDLILQGRSLHTGPGGNQLLEDFDELADAWAYIPNDDLDWNDWTSWGLALFAATNGAGFELFDAFSLTSTKYNAAYTRQRWREIASSPPDRTGAGKIFKAARAHGWTPKLRMLPATDSKPDAEVTPEAARDEIQRNVFEFLDAVARPASELDDPFVQYYFETRDPDCPLVRAIKVPTGIGKTKITLAELAAWLRSTSAGPVLYAVPGHKLSPHILKQFEAHGINARIFYGREHADPEKHDPSKSKDEQILMCLNLPAVVLAKRAHADITKTCCKDGKKRCIFHNRCGYVGQQVDAEDVQVWVCASDMLFHTQKALGKPVAVIADEGFWRKGLRGIEQEDVVVPLDSLLTDKPVDLGICHSSGQYTFAFSDFVFSDRWVVFFSSPLATRDFMRGMLGNALLRQQENGPVERQHLTETTKSPAFIYEGKVYRSRRGTLTPHDCARAISAEWKLMPEFGLEPGMSQAQIAAVCNPEIVDEIRHTRNIITIWKAVREVLSNSKITTSGRLLLKQQNGQRVVAWRGVAEITKQSRVPTLLLDATLPDQSILQCYHPQVEIAADLKVAMPTHVRIKQVLDAPTSSRKLRHEKHLRAVLRYILQRWNETGRQETLVICQKEVERWLIERGLPSNIHIEHYNNISGLDDYRAVRLLILVGRTAPGPEAIEAQAAALSAQQPVACKAAAGSSFAWFEKAKRGIKLRDGSMIETDVDQHPDAMAEAVRWLIHEGELLQALGRARALNRTADNPLDLDLLFDAALPITVDEVERWRTPSLLLTPAFDEGVVLIAPCDLVRAWPKLWANQKAAERCVRAGVPELPGFVEIGYQLQGPKMQRKRGYFDLARIPDPSAWLARRLGPVILL